VIPGKYNKTTKKYLLSVNNLIPKFTKNPEIVVLGNVHLRMRVCFEMASAFSVVMFQVEDKS
jgi:hypothetical protein